MLFWCTRDLLQTCSSEFQVASEVKSAITAAAAAQPAPAATNGATADTSHVAVVNTAPAPAAAAAPVAYIPSDHAAEPGGSGLPLLLSSLWMCLLSLLLWRRSPVRVLVL